MTDGGRELRAYLTSEGTNVPKFAALHGLDRIQLQRVIKGELWQRISVDFAKKIEAATAGAVRWDWFCSVTAKAGSGEYCAAVEPKDAA